MIKKCVPNYYTPPSPDKNDVLNSTIESQIMQVDGNISLNSSVISSSSSEDEIPVSSQNVNQIPVITTNRNPVQHSAPERNQYRNVKGVRTCNKLLDAVQLPVIVNLNPRSIYNKSDEFKTMMEQMDVSLCFMSESWDRDNNGIEEVIKMDGFKIIPS